MVPTCEIVEAVRRNDTGGWRPAKIEQFTAEYRPNVCMHEFLAGLVDLRFSAPSFSSVSSATNSFVSGITFIGKDAV